VYSTDLKVGVVVEVDPVGVSLGELGEGSGFLKLSFELVNIAFSKLKEVIGTSNGRGVSHGRVMVIMDEATMVADYFIS